MAPTKKAPPSAGKWIDDIINAVGKYVTMETTDGVRREGKLSGYRSRNVVLNGKIQEVVTDLELNSDPADTVPFASLDSLTIN